MLEAVEVVGELADEVVVEAELTHQDEITNRIRQPSNPVVADIKVGEIVFTF